MFANLVCNFRCGHQRLQARSYEDITPLPEADYMRTIFDLLDFTDCACAMATMLEKQNMAIFAAILSFYEYSCGLNAKFDLPLTIVPSHGVAYSCLLAASLDVVSRFCGVLNKMIVEVENVKAIDRDSLLWADHDGLENLDYFNL